MKEEEAAASERRETYADRRAAGKPLLSEQQEKWAEIFRKLRLQVDSASWILAEKAGMKPDDLSPFDVALIEYLIEDTGIDPSLESAANLGRWLIEQIRFGNHEALTRAAMSIKRADSLENPRKAEALKVLAKLREENGRNPTLAELRWSLDELATKRVLFKEKRRSFQELLLFQEWKQNFASSALAARMEHLDTREVWPAGDTKFFERMAKTEPFLGLIRKTNTPKKKKS